MKNILLAPNPTGTGHNIRMLNIGKELLSKNNSLNITVLLGSRQDVFTELFTQAKINVIDLSPSGIIDHSKESHLSFDLDWDNMISKYFVPTFFNGDKILKYIELISKCDTDIVISDYNINATIAAIILGKKNVFVTERHNFTLVDIPLEDLNNAGFNVNTEEIITAKRNLRLLFNWILTNTDLLITDKVILPEFSDNLKINNPKINFVGSIYKPRQGTDLSNFDYSQKYIVATATNTTMIKEDSILTVKTYVSAFEKFSKKVKGYKLVLIGDIPESTLISKNNDIISLLYFPNWEKLILNAQLLWSHPGWISVTEIAYLGIKSIFYLPSFMEYHEVEAFNRLKFLDLPTVAGSNPYKLSDLTIQILDGQYDSKMANAYHILNPDKNGLEKATNKILALIESEVSI